MPLRTTNFEPFSNLPSGTEEYKAVCKFGAGTDKDGNDINECLNNMGIKIGMCTHGKCVNMAPGYKCKCNPGFKNQEDDDHICEGMTLFRFSRIPRSGVINVL